MTLEWAEQKNKEAQEKYKLAEVQLKKDFKALFDFVNTNGTEDTDFYMPYDVALKSILNRIKKYHQYIGHIIDCYMDGFLEFEDNKEYNKLADKVVKSARDCYVWLELYYRFVDSEPVQFDGDIIITDPCYIVPNDNWSDFCDEHKDIFDDSKKQPTFFKYSKSKTMIYRDTVFGDWGCNVYNNSRKKIGYFCADAGLVCVVTKEDALKINPEFDCTDYGIACIDDFHGKVWFEVKYNDKFDKTNINCLGCDEAKVIVHGEGTRKGKPFAFHSVP